jgi:hypothetical protein
LDAVNARQIADHAQLPDSHRAEALRSVAPDAVQGRMRLSAWVGAVRVPVSSAGSAASGMPSAVSLARLFDVVYTRDVWMHTRPESSRSMARNCAKIPRITSSLPGFVLTL